MVTFAPQSEISTRTGLGAGFRDISLSRTCSPVASPWESGVVPPGERPDRSRLASVVLDVGLRTRRAASSLKTTMPTRSLFWYASTRSARTASRDASRRLLAPMEALASTTKTMHAPDFRFLSLTLMSSGRTSGFPPGFAPLAADARMVASIAMSEALEGNLL